MVTPGFWDLTRPMNGNSPQKGCQSDMGYSLDLKEISQASSLHFLLIMDIFPEVSFKIFKRQWLVTNCIANTHSYRVGISYFRPVCHTGNQRHVVLVQSMQSVENFSAFIFQLSGLALVGPLYCTATASQLVTAFWFPCPSHRINSKHGKVM